MSELESDLFWRPEALKVVRTQSPRMRQVLEKLKSVAPTRTTVLLLGDTGVGKGMIAKLIHQHSSRSDMPFVHLHCGAIPETLVESELFGYEKGAFTGANKRKLGRFDKAQGGMLFLDEVNTITPSTQIKLLQVLQERIFQRVGGEQPIEADVRIITASNSDLSALCEEGSFRRDLYYRLSVFPIQLPSLRERTEDIPQIIDSLIEWFNQHYFKDIQGIDPFVIKALKQYDWPGNVRELENIIERAYILEQNKGSQCGKFSPGNPDSGRTHRRGVARCQTPSCRSAQAKPRTGGTPVPQGIADDAPGTGQSSGRNRRDHHPPVTQTADQVFDP